MILQTTRFAAMGTEIEIITAEASPESVAEVQRLFIEVEERLSRFGEDSELSRLNRAQGRPFRASPMLREVLEYALAAARATDGLFDPTIHGALVAAGYARTFAELGLEQRRAAPAPTDFRLIRSTTDGDVVLEGGVTIDLGGIAKGWTVDRAIDLLGAGVAAIVNAGGDLRAAGAGPDGQGWLVGVQDPLDPERNLGIIALQDAALATSSVVRRSWQTTRGRAHHLIDPRTGCPAETDLLAVSAAAPTCAEAEALAKAALLLGVEEGRAFLRERTGGWVVVDADGRAEWSPGFEVRRVA